MSGIIMARISRRHILHAANASILAAALAMPASLTIAAADSQSLDGGRAGVPAQPTAPPPPASTTPRAPTEPTTPPPSPSTTTSPEPTTSAPTSPTDTSPDPDDTDGQKIPPEQDAEIDEATKKLNEQKERVSEELVSTVGTLSTMIDAVQDPTTSPQDRQGVIESTENLAATLAAIGDPKTSPELRKELTAMVKQVTSALKAVNDPRVPAEERSILILVVKRTTSALDMIRDSHTPPDVRDRLIAIVNDISYATERSQHGVASRSYPEGFASYGLPVSSSLTILVDPNTPPKEREKLANSTQQVGALLKTINDPGTSQEERAEAIEELEEKAARMKDQQEHSVSAQERPDQSLGKAAAFCTSAIFESTPEHDLMQGLRKLLPTRWADEGVKDFWKAEEENNKTLDILVQLQSDTRTRGPFPVKKLIPELAELVPHDRLFASLGPSALSCEQTATYLAEDGTTVGTWLSE
ncbi:hypothetical protein ACFZAU_39240 [Streptomyces sp. NPDC008238]